MASYDTLIPPEVSNDKFYRLIERLARRKEVRTILEIGSSSGDGSTAAFVSGMDRNGTRPLLYCIEIAKVRFDALKQRYAGRSDVRCYNVSTVSLDKFPSEADVFSFHGSNTTGLNRYPLKEVIEWLRQDIEYIQTTGVQTDGIKLIKREAGIVNFDLVLIDGSAFTGAAELDEVYGAKTILLDDINDIKNLQNYQRLSSDPQYRLITENWKLRNGYAAFGRRRETNRRFFGWWPFARSHTPQLPPGTSRLRS